MEADSQASTSTIATDIIGTKVTSDVLDEEEANYLKSR